MPGSGMAVWSCCSPSWRSVFQVPARWRKTWSGGSWRKSSAGAAEERRVFIRRYWYGDGVKELAAEAGERANTLAQRLSRLRKSLRGCLESEGVEL